MSSQTLQLRINILPAASSPGFFDFQQRSGHPRVVRYPARRGPVPVGAGEKGRVLDSQPKPLGVVGHQSGFGKLGGPCVIHAGEVVRLIACIVALLIDGVERCPVRKRVCGPVLTGLATCCLVGRGE
jgi:hypothetical protein